MNNIFNLRDIEVVISLILVLLNRVDYAYSKLTSIYITHTGNVVVVIVWYLDLQLHVELVAITTNVVSSNPSHGEVYSMQHYVMNFVNDLRQVGGFL